MLSEQILPHSEDAERATLGAILLDADATLPDAIAELAPESFYKIVHQTIFKTMLALYDERKPVDMVSVTQNMESNETLEATTPGYLAGLLMDVPGTTNLSYYVGIVAEKYRLRRLITLSHKILANAFEPDAEPSVLSMALLAELGRISAGTNQIVTMAEAVGQAMAEIRQILASEKHIAGLSTGFDKIDQFTGGLVAPHVWVIAARPGIGKTALAMNIATNVAQQSCPVGIITLEMSACALAKRTLAAQTKINMRHLRFSTPEERTDLEAKSIATAKLPIFFDERPALTGAQIRTAARGMKHRHGCKLFILDYLQLAQTENKRSDRQNQVAELSGQIKAMAKELNAPVILLSQLNRASTIGNRRPMLADLRDSGAIEQDADLVAFLNVDLEDAELPDVWQGKFDEQERSRIVQFDIAKQREGETVAAYLRFDRETTNFENLLMRDQSTTWQERADKDRE